MILFVCLARLHRVSLATATINQPPLPSVHPHLIPRSLFPNAQKPGESVAQSSPIGPTTNGNHANGHPDNLTSVSNDVSADEAERGRTRKKRDFFGTLKRKLGRSKSRAKSMDRGMIPIDANNPTAATAGTSDVRSVSADRGALGSNSSAGTVSHFIVDFLPFQTEETTWRSAVED